MLFKRGCFLLSDIDILCRSIEDCDLDLNDREMIILAVVCAEDRRYFSHHGVCYPSIVRAIYRRHGGASTINMQLVRIITGRYELSFTRKLREIFISTIIDFKYTKVEILRAYLCFSYYGHNMKGLDGVINDFFPGKKSTELSIYDCCFIASLIKRPLPMKLTISWAMKIDARMTYIHRLCLTIGKKVLKKIRTN